eukprot:scaffold3273_cov126-Isochrysis_galbana.AAC.7
MALLIIASSGSSVSAVMLTSASSCFMAWPSAVYRGSPPRPGATSGSSATRASRSSRVDLSCSHSPAPAAAPLSPFSAAAPPSPSAGISESSARRIVNSISRAAPAKSSAFSSNDAASAKTFSTLRGAGAVWRARRIHSERGMGNDAVMAKNPAFPEGSDASTSSALQHADA